jgi:hypothetical protein
VKEVRVNKRLGKVPVIPATQELRSGDQPIRGQTGQKVSERDLISVSELALLVIPATREAQVGD